MKTKMKKGLSQDDLEYSAAYAAAGLFIVAIHSGVPRNTADKMLDFLLCIFVKNKTLGIEWLFYICVEQCNYLKVSVEDTETELRDLLEDDERTTWFLENLKAMANYRK